MMGGLFRDKTHWRADIIGAAVMLLVMASATFGYIIPTWRQHADIRAKNEQIATGRDRIAETERTINTLTLAIQARENSATASNKVQLAPVSALNAKLATVTSLAEANGLEIDSVEPSPVTYGPNCGSVMIRFTGRGTYATFAVFLRSLSELSPDVAAQSVELTANGNQVGSGALATFDTKLQWLVSPAVAIPQRTGGTR